MKNATCQKSYRGGSRIWLRGGAQLWSAQICRCSTVESHEQSELIKVWGLGPTLGPQKLLGFSWLNICILLVFLVPFDLIFSGFYLYKMLIKTF